MTKDGCVGRGGSCECRTPGRPGRVSGIWPCPKAPWYHLLEFKTDLEFAENMRSRRGSFFEALVHFNFSLTFSYLYINI